MHRWSWQSVSHWGWTHDCIEGDARPERRNLKRLDKIIIGNVFYILITIFVIDCRCKKQKWPSFSRMNLGHFRVISRSLKQPESKCIKVKNQGCPPDPKLRKKRNCSATLCKAARRDSHSLWVIWPFVRSGEANGAKWCPPWKLVKTFVETTYG